jgi:hypothetical protein
VSQRASPKVFGVVRRALRNHLRRTFFGFAFLLLIASLALSLGPSVLGSRFVRQSSAPTFAPQLPRQAQGSERCVLCHKAEVDGYSNSAMAHSLRRAGQEPQGEVNIADGKITAFSTAAGAWQRLETSGDVTDYRVDYVIGSGNHASGYLINLGDHLFQSPLAFYKSRQASRVPLGRAVSFAIPVRRCM